MRRLSAWLVGVVGIVSACAGIWRTGLAGEDDLAAYTRAIARAGEALDAGHIEEARRTLDGTAAASRGFEHAYLAARLAAAKDTDRPAPDLLKFIAKPDVDTRNGMLDPKGRRVVFLCRDGGLRIHDRNRPDAPPEVKRHPKGEAIWSGAFSPDGNVFVSGHQNGDVLVWDAGSWEVRHTIPLAKDVPVRELEVARDGKAFAAEGTSEVELWSLEGDAPKKVAGIGPRYNFGEGLAFSPAEDLVATGGMFDIILHDARTGKELRSIQHASYTMGLAFSPDGKSIASAPRGNVNKFLALFDLRTDTPIFQQGPLGNYVAGMAFSPDGRRIAVVTCENQLRLYETATGRVVYTLVRKQCGMKPAFSRDGKVLGWSEPDGFWTIDLAAAAEPAR